MLKAVLLGLSLCLVLFVGIVLWLSCEDCTASPRRLYHRIVLGDKDFIGSDTRFRVRGDGTSLLPNGRLAGFRTVRASDCVDVIIQGEDEDSPAQAEDEMEKRIRGAYRVIGQGPKDDLPSHPGGTRAVLLIENGAKAEVVLRFKDDKKLHTIESTSLAHALAYEKLIQGGHRLDPTVMSLRPVNKSSKWANRKLTGQVILRCVDNLV